MSIWDEWADEKGNLGPIYGHQWRSWTAPDGETVDQIEQVISLIKTDPNSRRLLVNAWNVGEIKDMALLPCHCLFQFFVAEGRLSCQLYQRSADFFLGVPFNIASYALLTSMIAQVCNLKPGEFIHTLGDTHIYKNHFKQARKQMTRIPKPLPVLFMNSNIRNIFDFRYEDFRIVYPGHNTEATQRCLKKWREAPELPVGDKAVDTANKKSPSSPISAPISV